MLAYKEGARVRLLSRHGVDHTKRFAGIAAAITKLSARTLVLDGEVGIYDQQLRSRFEWPREPDQRRRVAAAARVEYVIESRVQARRRKRHDPGCDGTH